MKAFGDVAAATTRGRAAKSTSEDDMRSRMIFGLILVLAAPAWTADRLTPLNVKTGLWKVTRSITTSGEMPIPAEMLSRLTPEQRARVEARMKAASGEKTNTKTEKQCLTREQLDKYFVLNDDQEKQCTTHVVSSSSSKAEVRYACNIEGMKGSGTVHIEALSPENVKGEGHNTATGNGRTFHSSMAFTATWLGPACGSTR